MVTGPAGDGYSYATIIQVTVRCAALNRTVSGPPCPPPVDNEPLQRFGVQNSCSHQVELFGPRNAVAWPERTMELKGVELPELQLYSIQIPSFGPNVTVGSFSLPLP